LLQQTKINFILSDNEVKF